MLTFTVSISHVERQGVAWRGPFSNWSDGHSSLAVGAASCDALTREPYYRSVRVTAEACHRNAHPDVGCQITDAFILKHIPRSTILLHESNPIQGLSSNCSWHNLLPSLSHQTPNAMCHGCTQARYARAGTGLQVHCGQLHSLTINGNGRAVCNAMQAPACKASAMADCLGIVQQLVLHQSGGQAYSILVHCALSSLRTEAGAAGCRRYTACMSCLLTSTTASTTSGPLIYCCSSRAHHARKGLTALQRQLAPAGTSGALRSLSRTSQAASLHPANAVTCLCTTLLLLLKPRGGGLVQWTLAARLLSGKQGPQSRCS